MNPPVPFNVERDCTCGHHALPQIAEWHREGEEFTFCSRDCYMVWFRQTEGLPNVGLRIGYSNNRRLKTS